MILLQVRGSDGNVFHVIEAGDGQHITNEAGWVVWNEDTGWHNEPIPVQLDCYECSGQGWLDG